METNSKDTARPIPDTMDSLRTPSYAYNHGGYYAPADPRECDCPGGICVWCQARIDAEKCCATRPDFMEPCPSCDKVGSYVTHESKGLRTCNGCEDKICTECYHGCRYCCAYVLTTLPPPPPISPRCSEEKWRAAEQILRNNPEESQVIAEHIPKRHMYVVSRSVSGDFVRQHSSQQCYLCGEVEIPNWANNEDDNYVCSSCYAQSVVNK